jgi:hypothetical protein
MIDIRGSLEDSLPSDFDVSTFLAVQGTIGQLMQKHPGQLDFCSMGWQGIGYRFLACREASDQYTETVKRYGTGPGWPHRYEQDRSLFTFFVNALSCFECFGFGFWGAAWAVDQPTFPLTEPRDIALGNLRAKLEANFPGETVTTKLAHLLGPKPKPAGSPLSTFDEVKLTRDALAHRVQPGRIFNFGGRTGDRLKLWNPVDLDNETTTSRLAWLSGQINELMDAARQFCADHKL